MSLVTYPFHFLASIIRFLFQTLRIPFPTIPISFTSLSLTSLFSRIRAPIPDPYSESDRWVRTIEEETGTLLISRGNTVSTAFGKKEVEGEAGPSGTGTRSRYGAVSGHAAGGKVLPDFWIGSYEEALRVSQQQLRVLCVILVSAEHDDTLPFKRDTLTHPALVDILTIENFLVWGGDVGGRDAWSASQKLGVTTFPFVAFAALQPPRGLQTPPRNSSPVMTVLSRHQGAASTTAALLCEHINNSLLPRVKPFLQRLLAQQQERELERQLREEQDRRFEESARRDRERLEMVEMEELRRLKSEEEEQAKREELELRQAMIASAKDSWRRTARHRHIPSDTGKGTIRIGARLPDGRRVTAAFSSEDSILTLYCVIDQALYPVQQAEFSDESSADLDELLRRLSLSAEEWWGFTVSQSYPRRNVPFQKDKTISEMGVEGSLSVEFVSQRLISGEDDDDGYHTEDE